MEATMAKLKRPEAATPPPMPTVPLDEPTLETHLGASLKEARKESRKTQADAADHLKVTHSAIGQWERGLTLPSLTNLISIAELYGASLDGLIWNMQNKFDARLRELPPFLRDGLVSRW
jgi:transcriptional regulator with XRE-family HTH domain